MVVETSSTTPRPEQLDNEPEFESSSIYSDNVDDNESSSDSSHPPPKLTGKPKAVKKTHNNNSNSSSSDKYWAKEELRKIKEKAHEKKICRAAVAIAWLEVVIIIIILTVYSIIAFRIFPEEIGDKLARTNDDYYLKRGYIAAIIFGAIVWVVLYIIAIAFSIYYRLDESSSNWKDLCIRHLAPAAGNVAYHLIRWPILALMLVYAVDGYTVDDSLVACAFWFDTLFIGCSAVIVLVVWGTIILCK